MKYKNIDIVNKINILNKFKDKKLPPKITYAIMKNTSVFYNEYSVYEKALNQIFKNYEKFFVKDENGKVKTSNGIPIVEEDKGADFVNEINELLKTEVDMTPYFIDESIFEYDNSNGIYDVLTSSEIFMLVDVLCEKTEKE